MTSLFDRQFDEAMIGKPPYKRFSKPDYCPVCGEEIPPSFCFGRRHLRRCYIIQEIIRSLLLKMMRERKRQEAQRVDAVVL